MLRSFLLVLFSLVAAWSEAADTSLLLRTTLVPIGTRGAQLEFPSGWGRSVQEPSLGQDQYRTATGEEYLLLLELPGNLSTDEVLRKEVASREASFDGMISNPVFTPLGTATTATTTFFRERMDASVGAARFSYVFGAVGLSHARYLVLAWSFPKNFDRLLRDIDGLMTTLAWDTSSDAYRDWSSPKEAVSTSDKAVVVVRYSAKLYDKSIANEEFPVRLNARTDDVTVKLTNAGAAPDGGTPGSITVVDVEGHDKTYAYVFNQQVSGKENRLTVSLAGPDGPSLQIQGPWSADTLKVEAGYFLSSMDLEVGNAQAALPVKPDSSKERAWFDKLRAVSSFEGSVDDSPRAWVWNQGKPWFVTDNGTGVIEAQKLAYRVKWDDDTMETSAAPGPAGLLLQGAHGKTWRVEGTELVANDWKSERLLLGQGQAGVGLVRRAGDPSLKVPFNVDAGSRDDIVLRSGDHETVVATLAKVTQGAFDGEGQRLLVSSEVSPDSLTLTLIVPGSAPSVLGTWSRVDAVLPADGGWLVSGTPEGGAPGWWLVNAPGARTPLLTDLGLTVLGAHEGRLWYAVPSNWDKAEGDWKAKRVYSVPLDAVKKLDLGPKFSAASLNQVGLSHGLDKNYPPLPTAEAARAFIAGIRRDVVAADGAWPDDPRFFDTLVTDSSWPGLKLEGFRVLSLLLCGALLEAGAEWVDSSSPGDQYQPAPNDDDYAVTAFPPVIVHSVLYESEGWYNPVATLLDERNGRPLLVGLSSTAIRARQTELGKGGWDPLQEHPDPAALGRLLSSPALAKNQELRKTLFQTLWNRGDLDTLTAVLRADANGGAQGRLYSLLLKWVANHSSLASEADAEAVFGGTPEAAIPGLKQLMLDTDDPPILDYFLGKAWEFSHYSFAKYNARQCYQAVGDGSGVSDGLKDLAEQASKALESDD
jgi:hypothetical protein